MENLKKIVLFNLILLSCLVVFFEVKAQSAANTELLLAITGGSLSVEAPTSAAFAGKAFSFVGQTSANNPLGTVTVTDARGTKMGWGVNITASDWIYGDKVMQYNGNGTSEGQLSLNIPSIGEVVKVAGEDVTNFTMGVDDNFDDSVAAISLVSAASGSGSGEYDFNGLSASQFIPGNQETGSYTTRLTLTIS